MENALMKSYPSSKHGILASFANTLGVAYRSQKRSTGFFLKDSHSAIAKSQHSKHSKIFEFNMWSQLSHHLASPFLSQSLGSETTRCLQQTDQKEVRKAPLLHKMLTSLKCTLKYLAAESHSPKRWWRSQNVSFAGSRVFHGSRSERGVLSIAPHLVLSLQKCLRNPSTIVLNVCHLSLLAIHHHEVHSCLFSLNKEVDFICTKCVAWYVAGPYVPVLPRGTQRNPSWGARIQTNTYYTMTQCL